jgi:hypothetical protein
MLASEILLKFAIASIGCSLLLGCKSDEKEFSNLLEEWLQEKKECYMPIFLSEDGPFRPVYVLASDGRRPNSEILAGLLDQGLIKKTRNGLTEIEINLTDEGHRQSVWSGGFCIGVRQLDEIVRYTYGDNGQNENFATVEYTYKIGEHPDWFDAKYYQEVPGVAEPKTRKVTFQKSSDGWHLRDF